MSIQPMSSSEIGSVRHRRIIVAIDRTARDLACAQSALELAIAVTPTSECRNKLTDANICLMHAVEALKAAEALTP